MTCSLDGEYFDKRNRMEAVSRVSSANTHSMVLAGMLGLHHRVNWKDCVQSEGDDKDDAQKFKKAFAPYAPSS